MKDTQRFRILFFGGIFFVIAGVVLPTVSVLGVRWYKSRTVRRFVDGVAGKDEKLAHE